MVVSMGGGASNLMRALQTEIAMKEAERQRKIANVNAGVQGFTGAQAVGNIQDNIANLVAAQQQAPENQRPYAPDAIVNPITGEQTGSHDWGPQAAIAPTAPTPPPSALANLDTGGFFARFAGGMNGPEAYQRNLQGPLSLALLQDRNNREDWVRGQQWNREDQARMAKLAQEAQAKKAVASAYGLGEVDPNLPMSAYDNLVRMREKRDADKRMRDRNDTINRSVFSDAIVDPITGEQTQSALDPFRLSTRDELTRSLASSGLDPSSAEAARTLWSGLQPPAPKPTLADKVDETRALSTVKAEVAAKFKTPEEQKKPADVKGYAESMGIPYFAGMDFTDVDRVKRRMDSMPSGNGWDGRTAAVERFWRNQITDIDDQISRLTFFQDDPATKAKVDALTAEREKALSALKQVIGLDQPAQGGETKTMPDGKKFVKRDGRWVLAE